MKKFLLFLFVMLLPLASIAGELPEVTVLSDTDAGLYTQIFDLQQREKIPAAQKLEKELTDKLLINEVLVQRYISKTYRTKGVEITNWMTKYYNMPSAPRMEKLAKIKKASVRSVRLPTMANGN